MPVWRRQCGRRTTALCSAHTRSFRPAGAQHGSGCERRIGWVRAGHPAPGLLPVLMPAERRVAIGRLALGRPLQELAELDQREVLGIDRAGFEVLLPAGERVGSQVHHSPVRPARQSLYVTRADARASSEAAVWLIPRPAAGRQNKTRSDLEPVSGIEPLPCRLQEAGLTAPSALPALTQHRTVQNAQNARANAGPSFHEPFQACARSGRQIGHAPYPPWVKVTIRSRTAGTRSAIRGPKACSG